MGLYPSTPCTPPTARPIDLDRLAHHNKLRNSHGPLGQHGWSVGDSLSHAQSPTAPLARQTTTNTLSTHMYLSPASRCSQAPRLVSGVSPKKFAASSFHTIKTKNGETSQEPFVELNHKTESKELAWVLETQSGEPLTEKGFTRVGPEL